MEKHVPSLDRCKRMRELGIEFPESLFVYAWMKEGLGTKKYETPTVYLREYLATGVFDYVFPAPLVSELLEVMPDGVSIIKGGDFYSVFLDIDSTLRVDDINLPNALADLLIYLKENNDL